MIRSIALPGGRARTLFLALSLAMFGAAPLVRAQTTLVDVVKAVTPSITTVSVVFAKGDASGGLESANTVRIVRPGSGVVVDPKGLILTNLHLVAETLAADGTPARDFWAIVSLSNGRQYPATVVATDARTDLALLSINAGSSRLKALPLGEPRKLAPGTRILAVSYAGGEANNVFAGVLDFPGAPVLLRDATLSAEETLLSDARFHASLDGGPLLDLQGRVLGLHNSSHVSTREGFSEEEDDEEKKKVDESYSVIVSADAIRAAFPDYFSAETTPPTPLEEAPESPAVAAVAAIAPSVVSVWTGEEPHPATADPKDPHSQRPPEHLGSGVVISADGLVLTTAALFPEETTTASVRLATGEVYPARLLAKRKPLAGTPTESIEEMLERGRGEMVERALGKVDSSKIALLVVELPEGVTLPAATLADSKAALAGELAAVVGRPFNSPTLSVGVVSALERGGFMQVANWVHRGHHGGALVDRNGRLLGIATAQPMGASKVAETSFLGFAAPLSTLLEAFTSEIAEHGTPTLAEPYDEAATEARRTAAARVVERTKGSLVNVLVSKAKAVESTGFNPFGDPEPTFSLLGQGSGVIIDPTGLALTNWHVVSAALKDGVHADDHRVEVTLPNGDKYIAHVLSTSRDDDLALIALQLEPGQTLVPVELGDSSQLRQGQTVIAIGNPLGLANSVSAGIVSCEELDVRIQGRLREYKGMLMTDAAINPGNSGGALLDEEARLVGINSAGRIGAGMAIPVDKAREVFADKLLSAENLRSSFLGLRVAEHEGSLMITVIDELSPADEAELEVGDEVLAIDGRRGLTLVAFAQLLLEAEPGEPLALTVGRRGEEVEVVATPIPHAAWNAFRESGVLVDEVDYSTNAARVHAATVALHRAYTGDERSNPSRLMGGALQVRSVRSLDSNTDHPVRRGDWILGISKVTRGAVTDSHALTRFETLADLAAAFGERATKDGELAECWILRADEGKVETVRFWIRRPPR